MFSKLRTHIKHPVYMTIAVTVVGLALIGAVLFLASLERGQTVINTVKHLQKVEKTTRSPSVTPTPVKTFADPVKAAVIARSLKCWRFRDLGPAMKGFVVDSGVCYKGGQKYGINTFSTSEARNSWIKMAKKLGVNPKWETATSVIYPSVNPNS
jgi:hypothetical protein